MLLRPDETCWRLGTAGRAALLIDMADYFDAAMTAMRRARRSVHLLNWALEPETLFHPEPGGVGDDADRISNFLIKLAGDNPTLDVRALCWKSAMPVAATQNFFPLMDREAFAGTPVKFVLDGRLPRGACHHQKAIIIDDELAFCGGGDIGPDRWDTCDHLDDDPRRAKPGRKGKFFDSRHEVMGLVDGPPARALGELFRARWLRATGEAMAPAPAETSATSALWPSSVTPGFTKVAVGISRTAAAWQADPEVREVEALHLASIAEARRCIYMENQYFTSPVIAQALARRLAKPKGPEVVLISAEHSPSYFDRMTMDRTRSSFIARLQAADAHGRLRVYSPVTTLGRLIIVHAKLTIIDDTLLRIGSANINNRSLGFDTECDLSIEAAGRGAAGRRAEIRRLRTRLLAHWLGCGDAAMDAAIAAHGGIGAGLEALRRGGYCRLRPIPATPLGPVAAFVATFHLGDPVGPKDSWRPWRRRRALASEVRKRGRAS